MRVLQQFIEDRVYDDGDPEIGAPSPVGGGEGLDEDVMKRKNKSREEVEAEFEGKASVALQAGQQFLANNFEQIKVS